jgi:hypothetical protein
MGTPAPAPRAPAPGTVPPPIARCLALPTNTSAAVGSRKPGVCSTHVADRLDGLVPRGFRRVGVIWAGRSHIWPVQWDAGLDHAAPRTGPALVVQRSDTPWYPTTRLFRQQTVRCWDDVV